MKAPDEQLAERFAQLERDLRVRYPRLVRDEEGGSVLAFGPGWYRIVDTWLRRVDALLTNDHAAVFQVKQIKEKLGALRIYWLLSASSETGDAGHVHKLACEEIRALTVAAEERSLNTCFVCGRVGALRRDTCLRVTCNECEANSNHAVCAH